MKTVFVSKYLICKLFNPLILTEGQNTLLPRKCSEVNCYKIFSSVQSTLRHLNPNILLNSGLATWPIAIFCYCLPSQVSKYYFQMRLKMFSDKEEVNDCVLIL